jgi:hypothetical protein
MKARVIVIICCVVLFLSCSSSSRTTMTMTMKLEIPHVFKEQATMAHVNGAKKNKMSFDQYNSSKIKRGRHVTYPGWGRGFILENLFWEVMNINLKKSESVVNEKAKFRFSLSDSSSQAEIFAKETEITRRLKYRSENSNSILNIYERVQHYEYIFSAAISTETSNGKKTWELLMTNIYDKKKENDKSLFTILEKNDNGLATNGQDTIFIKGLALKKTELFPGKVGDFPIRILSGYELSTPDGVIAIIDLIDKNVWFYNELEKHDRLIVASIATAIFARPIKDAW